MNPGDTWLYRAEELLSERRIDKARAAFDCARSLGADPDRCCGGLWMASMLGGDFETAWRMSDDLRQRNAPDQHRFWNGEDPAGRRVIVRGLHGYGDNVQMLRYAPRLARMAKRVIFEVAPRFVPLAPCFRGVSEVITWGEDASCESPVWDMQIEIMELPYLFRTRVDDLPIEREYLQLSDSELKRFERRMGAKKRPRAGVVWAGGEWNLGRSIAFDQLYPLLGLADFEFWNLQGGLAAREALGSGLQDAGSICGDGLLALASTVANLDMVISVDTLAAHLAGAIGKPVWLMLPYEADWRWMTERDDCPWYPSMRVFRQLKPGDWTSVIDSVCAALNRECRG